MLTPEEAVVEGRDMAESLMTDTIHVTRRSDIPVTDHETGKVTYPTETIHDGIGRIQARSTEGADYTVAGAAILIMTFQAQVPVTVALRKDDQIEITASATDQMMTGRKFRVESVVRKTHATKTVANVEEAP